MFAIRYAPDVLNPNRPKYFRPAGISARTFIPLPTISLYKNKENCNTAIFTEGEIKTAYANKALHDFSMFGFSGISNYKLCPDIKTAIKHFRYTTIVINYDSDARKSDNKTRLSSFLSSAINFYNEIISYYSLQGIAAPEIHLCIQNEYQIFKGIDDILFQHGNKAADAFRTLSTNEYFTFCYIIPTDAHQCIESFFNCTKAKIKGHVITAPYYSNKTENVRTRFTDILKANDLNFENKFFGKIYNVPTGTGKTSAIIAAADKQHVIFLSTTFGHYTRCA